MTSKHIIPVLFIIALLLYGAWIVYGLVFPRRLYRPGEKLSKIEVVAREKPYFHFTGLDNPHYYVITSQNFTNEFRVSGEVLDLVQDNDSISMAIKEIKFGDTLLLYVAISSVKLLNKGSSKIEIIGLENSMKTLIDPSNIENYYKELKSNNRFSLLVIAIILFFLIKKQIRKKREA